MRRKKRLLAVAGGLTAIAAAATMVMGVTFGLFSSQAASGQSTFTAGTVTVSNGAASDPCVISDLVPGDSNSGNENTAGPNNPSAGCTFVINNGSNVSTYAAVDMFIATGKASTVGSTYGSTATVTPSDLYDGSNSTGLNLSVSDGTNTYKVPGTALALASCTLAATDPFSAASAGLTNPSADTCYEVQDLLLSTSPIASSTTHIATLTVTWSLPSTAGNAYEGGDALVQFNAHEVQSAHNALTCLGGATPTVGQPCPATSPFSWS